MGAPAPAPALPRAPARLVPAQRFEAAVLLAAQGPSPADAGGGSIGVRAAIFDVDGVLTDGSLWIGEHGEAFKPFNSLDGHGLKLLAQGGITPIILTGRDSPSVRRRVADLGLREAHFGAQDKLARAEQILQSLQLPWAAVAVIGDDWPDLPLLMRAGFSCAPAQAHVEVRARVQHVTRERGGHGAAREFCDLLLMAKGCYGDLLNATPTTLDGR